MVLIRHKIFRRTKSAQRTRKAHKNYELGKSLTERCVFKWALNCSKLVMLRRVLRREFPNSQRSQMEWAFTGCLKINPGNFNNVSEDVRRFCSRKIGFSFIVRHDIYLNPNSNPNTFIFFLNTDSRMVELHWDLKNLRTLEKSPCSCATNDAVVINVFLCNFPNLMIFS